MSAEQQILDKAYAEVNDNIKFSEAKNAALITLNSALISVCAEKVFNNDIAFLWRVLIAFVGIFLIIPLVVSIFSFRAITGSEKCVVKKVYRFIDNSNQIANNPVKMLYYAYIAKHFKDDPEKYLNSLQIDSKNPIFLQMATQVVNLAVVAYRKFILFNISIKIEFFILAFGGFGALASVIIKLFTH